MVADDPGNPVGLVLTLGHRGIARPLGAGDLDRGLLHLERIVGIGLAALDLIVGQLAGMDRIAPGVLGPGQIVGHRLDFQDVEAAELGDLLKRQTGAVDKPDGIAWIIRNHPEISDAQIGKLIGTTRNTITAIRERSHWNISNINAKDPVTLGLCSQRELDGFVAKAAKKAGIAEDDAARDARLGDDREALIEELRAERDANAKVAADAAQEAEAAAWLEARRAEGVSDS